MNEGSWFVEFYLNARVPFEVHRQLSIRLTKTTTKNIFPSWDNFRGVI